MFKNAASSVCCGISWPLVSYSSTSSSVKTVENIEEDPDDPEPAEGGDIQMKCCH